MLSMRPRNVDVKFLCCRANAADHFRRPKRLAEERGPAIFRLADGAKDVTGVCGLIGVEASPRKLLFEFGVSALRQATGAHSESLALKALKKLFELRFAWLRNHQAALGCVVVVNFVKLAEFANAIEMAEEINDKEFVRSQRRNNSGPNQGCLFAAHRLATLRFEQFKADCFDVGAEVKRFNIERKRRQLQSAGIERWFAGSAHTSDSAWGNCS